MLRIGRPTGILYEPERPVGRKKCEMELDDNEYKFRQTVQS